MKANHGRGGVEPSWGRNTGRADRTRTRIGQSLTNPTRYAFSVEFIMRATTLRSISLATAAAMALSWPGLAQTPPASPQGFITVREFLNIGGGLTIPDLTNNEKFPDSPDVLAYPSFYLEWPAGPDEFTPPVKEVKNNYGVQMLGYYYPPATGNYIFYLAADDQARLFLSTDETAANKKLIAREPMWNPVRYFDPLGAVPTRRNATNPETDSSKYLASEWPVRDDVNGGAIITLTANKPYYIEALMKEGPGDDNLAVAIQVPGQNWDMVTPQSAVRLSTIDLTLGNASVRTQPLSQTVDEGTPAGFRTAPNGTPPFTYQWRRAGVDITDATDLTYNIPFASFADNGVAFSVVITGAAGAPATSADAILTVNRDTTAPKVIAATEGSDFETVRVIFSERVDISAATWAISGGVTLVGTPTQPNASTVILTTSHQAQSQTYTLTINGVSDMAATPNTIAADTIVNLTKHQTVEFVRNRADPLGTDSAFVAAWADFNSDGHIDVCTRNGSIRLYQNNGDGSFTRITRGNPLVEAQVNPAGGWGLIWGDYDNDRLPDLFVGGPMGFNSRNYLFHNEGDGGFSEVREGHIVNTAANSFSSVWGDLDGDGWLDLFVGNWVGDNGMTSNFLYRNEEGENRWALVSEGDMSTPFSNAASSQGSAAGDFDGDGRLDILNLAVRPSNARLYRNLGDLNFEVLYPTTDVVNSRERGSAAAVADYDNDGDLDILTAGTAQSGTTDGLAQLWQNNGRANFTRIREGALFEPEVKGAVGIAWADYDNDGWLDVVMSRDTFTNPGDASSNFLFHNNGDGAFSRVTVGEIVEDTGESQTSTWADINNDGFMDLLICNYDQANLLMLNKGNHNHWLKVTLRGTDSNADAIGAKVRVKATISGQEIWQLREITTSQGWLTSQNDMRPNFGLGDATAADVVRIEWPSGTVQELANVSADQILHIIEPPRLRIESGGRLSWPVSAEGFQLESAISVNGPWSQATETAETNGTRMSVTVKTDGSTKFYRLRMF